MTAICKITDGINSVSLIGPAFYISEWRPGGIGFKGDGYWQDAVFAEGRTLKQYAIANTTDTIVLNQGSASQDEAILQANRLAKILLTAADYSVRPKHGRRPLYLEVRGSEETNTRYARIHAGFVGEYGNPFSQPFLQPGCRATVEAINVIIERGPWLEAPPGTDVCQVIAPTGNRIGDTTITKYDYEDLILANAPSLISYPPFAMYKLDETSGTTAANSSTYGSTLDGTAVWDPDNIKFWNGKDGAAFIGFSGYVDIYSADFNSLFDGGQGSMLLWVNTTGPIWTGGQPAYFVNIQTPNSYARIFHPASPTNSITWEFNVNNNITSHNETGFSTSNRWFSIGMTWDDSANALKCYLNGSLVAEKGFFASWDGNIESGTCVIAASNNTPADEAVSTMAYSGFWNEILTDQDMELLGVPSDDRVSNIDFDPFDCEDFVAYIGNKRNEAELTHAYHFDTSLTTYSSNLINDTPPYALLPDPIGAGDILYLGIEQNSSSGAPDGPFNSAVFDISTAANATTSYTYTWEYWSGATWTALSDVVDNTDGLQEDGINSVHWKQPSNWATTSINSVTAYWVRLRVTSVSGTWTQPIASDEPYTIVRNVLEIPDSEVGGSIPALARMAIYNESSTGIIDEDDSFIERAVMGLRTTDLAPNFVSYINLSDEQNQPGVTVTAGDDTSFQNDLISVTGRSMNLVAGGTATEQARWTVSVGPSVASSYFGSYKAFVLYTVQTSTVNPVTTRFVVKVGSGYGHVSTINTGGYIKTGASPQPTHTVHEIGEITLRPDSFIGDGVDTIDFIWYSTTDGSLDVDFYALVLIPTDEWYGDFSTTPNVSFSAGHVDDERYLSIDSTRYPDKAVIAEVREDETNLSIARWKQSHNGPLQILTSGTQRFHFLLMKTDLELVPGTFAYYAMPRTAAKVKMFRNRRYNYGAGGGE